MPFSREQVPSCAAAVQRRSAPGCPRSVQCRTHPQPKKVSDFSQDSQAGARAQKRAALKVRLNPPFQRFRQGRQGTGLAWISSEKVKTSKLQRNIALRAATSRVSTSGLSAFRPNFGRRGSHDGCCYWHVGRLIRRRHAQQRWSCEVASENCRSKFSHAEKQECLNDHGSDGRFG